MKKIKQIANLMSQEIENDPAYVKYLKAKPALKKIEGKLRPIKETKEDIENMFDDIALQLDIAKKACEDLGDKSNDKSNSNSEQDITILTTKIKKAMATIANYFSGCDTKVLGDVLSAIDDGATAIEKATLYK